MNRYQTYLVDFLKKIKVFCDDNDIEFFIAYGEVIGAVRHHGFIPWDDDLDLVIKREEYRKLIKCADRMEEYGLELVCKDLDPEYEIVLSRLSDKTHTSIMPSGLYAEYALGLRIDIFILDPVPSEKFDEHRKNVMLYEAIGERGVVKTGKAVEFMDDYLRLKELEKSIGHAAVMEQIRAKVEKYTEEESDLYYIRWSPIDFYYKKELFDKPVYVDFEGTQFPCPNTPEEYLRKTYGLNWYMVPYIENARIHKLTVNLDIGYKNYTEDVYQFFDLDEAREVSRNKKNAHMHTVYAKEPVQSFRREIKAAYLCDKYDTADKDGALQALFDNGEYRAFLKEMAPLAGNVRLLKKNDLKAFDNSALVAKLLKAMIYSGTFYTADKIRKYFADQFGGREDFDEACKLLDKVIELEIAYQDRDTKTVEKLTSELKQFDDQIPDVIIGETYLFFNTEEGKKKYGDEEKLIGICDYYLKAFPENYDIIKRKADLLFSLGQQMNAKELYDIVYLNSRNGMDNLDLELNHGYSGRKYDE